MYNILIPFVSLYIGIYCIIIVKLIVDQTINFDFMFSILHSINFLKISITIILIEN